MAHAVLIGAAMGLLRGVARASTVAESILMRPSSNARRQRDADGA